jgi:vancomycin resistance protein YoaR
MAKDNSRAGDRAAADEADEPAKEFDQEAVQDAPEREEAVEESDDAAGAEPVEPAEPVADDAVAEPEEPDDGDDEGDQSGITAAAEVRRASVPWRDSGSSPVGSEPPAANAATPTDSATELLEPVAPLAVPVLPLSPQPVLSASTPAQAAAQAAAAARAAAQPVTSAAPTPASSSPLDVFEAEGRPAHRGRAAWIIVTTILVLAAGYVGAQWALADRVPPGTTVAGVDIGGMSSAKAVTALRAGLVDIETRGIPITGGDQSTTLLPDQAGLSVDAPATVKELIGFGLEPSRLLAQLTGGGRHDPVTVVDEQAFATSIAALADSLAVDPVDGSLVFVDGKPQPTPAVNGASVVADQAAQIIRTGWLTAPRPIKLPVAVVAPTIGQDQVDAAVRDVAGPLTDAPISVAVGDQIAELPASVVASVATFAPVSGKLTLVLDGKQLREEVLKRTRSLFTAPEDAHFTFVNNVPTLVPGAPGTTIDPNTLAAAVQAAGLSTTDRTAHVALVPTDPAQSTAAVEALGIKEKVSEFATPLTNEVIRTQNLVNAARILTGQIVQPGETFSVSKGVSPITVANGYQMAHAIVSGELTDVIGGGLSQMATTTYNAAFFAGLEDVEHTPHSVYFTRYPPGREATIFTGVVDMKFRNNTPYGILMQSWVAGGQLHVAMWSTKYWDVTTTTSAQSNVVQPKTVYSQSPTCVAKGAGNPGFSVTVTRTVSLAGVVAANEKKSWHYKPDDALVCGAAPAGP